MSLSPDTIILILNLSFFGAIILSFLIGLMRGFYKTTTYLVFSIVFFVVGMLLIGPITNGLLNRNLSFLNGFLPEEFHITTIKESLPAILAQQFPDQQAMFVEGTETMALAFGLVKMVIRLVLIIILLVLNATLLKIVPFITWLFIRPKRDEFTGAKPKKHRLFGGLVGAVKGVAVTVLLAIPLAGFGSMAGSLKTVMDLQDNSGASTTAATNEDDQMEVIFDSLGAYRNSIMGSVYGIPMGDKKMDEALFDNLLEVKIKTETSNTKVHIRKDFNKAVNILDVVIEANDGSTKIDPSLLFKITEEDLTFIQEELKGITLLNVVKNVGAEYGYDFILRDELNKDYEDEINLETLKEVDLNDELNILIDVVKIINDSDAQEDVFNEVFALTKEEANEVFDELAKLKIIQMGLPVGFNFFLGMDDVKATIENNNLDLDSIQKPTKEEFTTDFKNLVNIYTLAKDMDYEGLDDFETIDKDFVIEIEDVNVIDMFVIVFDFSFVYNNDELFANVAYDFATKSLPVEYQDILKRQTLVDNFNASELSSIALLGKLLFTEGLFDEGVNIDIATILTNNNIDKISTYISESNILSESTNGILDILTEDFAAGFTIEVPEDFSFKGAAGKTEIEAILYSVKDILDLGMLDPGYNYANLTESKIDDISTNFSNSQIIKYNLSPMINHLTSQTQFDFITSDEEPEFWTKAEIFNTLNAVKVFNDKGIDNNNLHTLDEETVSKVALSMTISNGIKSFLEHENEPGGRLAGKLVIPEDLTYYSTETEDGEIYHLFMGFNEMIGNNPIESFSPTASDVMDMDLDLIFNSKILEATVVEEHIKPLFSDSHLQLYIVDTYENGEEFDYYIDENPNNPEADSKDLLLALATLEDNGISYQTMNYATVLDSLETKPNAAQEINDVVIASAILTASLPRFLNQMINVEGGLGLTIYSDYNKDDLSYWGEESVNKELYFILDGLIEADDLKAYDYLSLNNTNKDDFKDGANKVAKSETLRQMLPQIITDSNLAMANSVRSTVDPHTLTETQWNNEIDVLVDIIVILNENPHVDFDSPDPADIPVLAQIKALMVNSLLYDETKLSL